MSGGLACIAGVAGVLAALPAFRHYTAPAGAWPDERAPGAAAPAGPGRG